MGLLPLDWVRGRNDNSLNQDLDPHVSMTVLLSNSIRWVAFNEGFLSLTRFKIGLTTNSFWKSIYNRWKLPRLWNHCQEENLEDKKNEKRSMKRVCIALLIIINQSIIVWTLKTKSLLPSLYKREELPLFGKEGRGKISWSICLLYYGLLSNSVEEALVYQRKTWCTRFMALLSH